MPPKALLKPANVSFFMIYQNKCLAPLEVI